MRVEGGMIKETGSEHIVLLNDGECARIIHDAPSAEAAWEWMHTQEKYPIKGLWIEESRGRTPRA